MKTLSTFLDEAIKLNKPDSSKAKALIQKIYSKGHRGMGHGRLFCIKRKGEDNTICAQVILNEFEGYVIIQEVTILGEGEDFGKGLGTMIMKMIVSEADKMGVRLELTAEPLLTPQTKKKAMNQAQLIKFYKRFGFQSYSGEKRNMFRDPK